MTLLATRLSSHVIEIEGYEKVVEFKDEKTGLHAIIALHDTRLGPALGGIRAFPYKSFDEALNDVLRLAKGMTYKSAIARTGTSGGKSVIILNPDQPKSEEMLLSFAEAVNTFQGHYICAEDVGMSVYDLAIVRKATPYVVGLPHPQSSGDPSPFTAWGCFRGIQAVCKNLWGNDLVKGKTFAIQGLGAVGMKIASSLFWHGARLIVTDVDPARTQQAAREFGAKVVHANEIYSVDCDVFTPCAMGGILNPTTIPLLKCKAVAGVANNQLLTEQDGEALQKRDILYCPDYVINGGGLMNVAVELYPQGYNPSVALDQIEHIHDALIEIFAQSKKQKKPTSEIADRLAEENLSKGIGKRAMPVTFHH